MGVLCEVHGAPCTHTRTHPFASIVVVLFLSTAQQRTDASLNITSDRSTGGRRRTDTAKSTGQKEANRRCRMLSGSLCCRGTCCSKCLPSLTWVLNTSSCRVVWPPARSCGFFRLPFSDIGRLVASCGVTIWRGMLHAVSSSVTAFSYTLTLFFSNTLTGDRAAFFIVASNNDASIGYLQNGCLAACWPVGWYPSDMFSFSTKCSPPPLFLLQLSAVLVWQVVLVVAFCKLRHTKVYLKAIWVIEPLPCLWIFYPLCRRARGAAWSCPIHVLAEQLDSRRLNCCSYCCCFCFWFCCSKSCELLTALKKCWVLRCLSLEMVHVRAVWPQQGIHTRLFVWVQRLVWQILL